MNRANSFAGGGYWTGNSLTFSGLILFSWMGLLWCCYCAEELHGQEDSAQLQQAQIHQKEGRFAEAEAIYLDLIRQYPQSEEARESRTHLAVLYVAWDKPILAQNAYGELVADFTDPEYLAQAVRTIAYDCLRLKKPEKVLDLYKNLLVEYPRKELAIWSHSE